jgi:hypothetical protein
MGEQRDGEPPWGKLMTELRLRAVEVDRMLWRLSVVMLESMEKRLSLFDAMLMKVPDEILRDARIDAAEDSV